MLPIPVLRSVAIVVIIALATVAAPFTLAQTPTAGTEPASVVLAGLTNPRGFTWGADGTLYLALAGNGGDREGVWAGVPSGIFGGPTSSIVWLENGCPVTVAGGLPSGNWRDAGWVWGAMDVVFLDGQLYALLGGGGEDFGTPEVPNGVYRVNSDGTTTLVANLSSWLGDMPPAFVSPDYNSDGSLFDLEAAGGALFLSDAISGNIVKVTPDGTITRVADLSAGHVVPTGIAIAADGTIYVGNEGAAPYADGTAKVVKIAPDGTVSDAWTGLTRIGDIVLGPDGALYATELSTGNTDTAPIVHPGTGRVVKQTGADASSVVADGLDFPVGLGFGPDGALYVDGPANGADDGDGWLARIGGAPATPAAACATPVS